MYYSGRSVTITQRFCRIRMPLGRHGGREEEPFACTPVGRAPSFVLFGRTTKESDPRRGTLSLIPAAFHITILTADTQRRFLWCHLGV